METLSKVFEDKYNKNVKDCTNEEIYHGLLSWTCLLYTSPSPRD